MALKSNVGGNFWSKVLAGDRSVGVRRAEVVEIGDKSGEVGEWMKSLLILGGGAAGPGELRFNERRSCSTC